MPVQIPFGNDRDPGHPGSDGYTGAEELAPSVRIDDGSVPLR